MTLASGVTTTDAVASNGRRGARSQQVGVQRAWRDDASRHARAPFVRGEVDKGVSFELDRPEDVERTHRVEQVEPWCDHNSDRSIL